MAENLHHYRKSYKKGVLRKLDAAQNPLDQFKRWFDELKDSNSAIEINAMHCTTLDSEGFPRTRVVLLKGFDHQGFQFFTNYNSQKGRDIIRHPQVSLSFFWPDLERQVHIKGRAEQMSAEESDTYFDVRPRGSQIGAHVSDQSSVIESRTYLEQRLEALEAEYLDKKVPRPEHWGGFRVIPEGYEFWQGRENRLHDRLRYRPALQDDSKFPKSWIIERLAP
ncbi:MAG TPA: pyridoxamine 5'-phosphate oxidase [Flavobacteriaceae bacterium]|nr:pyridoxamine 5'-phosphate oxidase [Flavobacteriaceae bacterium]